MTRKRIQQKAIYLLAATALILTLLGTPMIASPIYAGDCLAASGNNCT